MLFANERYAHRGRRAPEAASDNNPLQEGLKKRSFSVCPPQFPIPSRAPILLPRRRAIAAYTMAYHKCQHESCKNPYRRIALPDSFERKTLQITQLRRARLAG